jgi:FkbM family methyltransferase
MPSFLDHAIQAVLAKVGLRLERKRPYRDPVIHFCLKAAERGVRTVLDVGANEGQFARELRRSGYLEHIHSFEPLQACREKLAAAAAGDPKWSLAPQAAVGSLDGTIEINVSANLVSSSILPITKRTVEAHAPARYVGVQQVPLRRLDALAADCPRPLAIKIDTQGFELEVLRGAGELLEVTQVVLLEMSLTPLYEGGVGFAELYFWMEQAGFRCIGITEGFSDVHSNEQLQADAVFVRV